MDDASGSHSAQGWGAAVKARCPLSYNADRRSIGEQAAKLSLIGIFAEPQRSDADGSEALDEEHCGEPTTRHLVS